MLSRDKIDAGLKLKDEANALVAQKEYKKACRLYRRVFGCVNGIVARSKEDMAKFVSPNERATAEEVKEAIQLLTAVYSNLALCYLKLEDPERAMEMAHQAVQRDPENVKALLRLGIASTMMKKWDQAKTSLLKAHGIEPDNATIKKEIGVFKEAYSAWDQEQKAKAKQAFGGKFT